MTVSIGIHYADSRWLICVTERDMTLECATFAASAALIVSLKQTCAVYPEARIALSLPVETGFLSLQNWHETEYTQQRSFSPEIVEVLLGIQHISQRAYLLPSINFLAPVPTYRQYLRPSLGSTETLCTVAALLYLMRQQEASWQELNFYCLDVLDTGYRLVVVKDGQIVDGIGTWTIWTDTSSAAQSVDTAADTAAADALIEQAFLEQLTKEFVGLMAIHHLDDIVILDRSSVQVAGRSRKDVIIDHFADLYQFFHFPQSTTEPAGFEAAKGAALLAYGLSQFGPAGELVQRLFSVAQAERLSEQSEG